MILKYFSQYLKDTNEVPTLEILFKWIKLKLETPAVCHEDKIIQSEIYLATTSKNDFCLIGKSETGRNLITSLYNYTLSYQNLHEARLLHEQQKKKDN